MAGRHLRLRRIGFVQAVKLVAGHERVFQADDGNRPDRVHDDQVGIGDVAQQAIRGTAGDRGQRGRGGAEQWKFERATACDAAGAGWHCLFPPSGDRTGEG